MVSISKRDWVRDADGKIREKIEYMVDSQNEINTLPTFPQISASSVAVIKPTSQAAFIVNGVWKVV